MAKCLVTGVAGFIGSHLAERLLTEGHEVIGIDCLTQYYDRRIKEDNLAYLLEQKGFCFIKKDVLKVDWKEFLSDVDFIFHHAAQPGVRDSWGINFESYVRNNITATQILLEAAKGSRIKKFIYASSSSIYGDAETFPTSEETLPRPVSPYGATKLAAEHLCYVYHKNFGLPIVILRYFTVYGPRQRPDMAFHRFIKAMLLDNEIVIYGDGEQTRDFTFISDVVEANLLAMDRGVEGEIFNIGGGTRIRVRKVLSLLEDIMGKKALLRYVEPQKGDVRHTGADISKAETLLGYCPKVGIEEGLEREVSWLKRWLTKNYKLEP